MKIKKLGINNNYGVDKMGNFYSRVYQYSKKGKQGIQTEVGETWIKIRGTMTKRGYIQIRIDDKSYRLNRLLAIEFLPNPHNYPEVHHVNGVKNDNRIKNLRWGTQLHNANDRDIHGNTVRGVKSPNAKLNPEKIRKIRVLRREKSLNDLAKIFGVSRKLILLVAQNKIWKGVI